MEHVDVPWIQSLSVTIQMKNTEQYFSVVLFTMHYSVLGGSKF